ncbi:hypothetical protein INF23_10785 [Ligilactobacillus salivarius]|uniref:hypothetical protein n=1 Tax=Ligilactobacillus salivarius TaxID=1624 RepID=UPI001873536D|nr:hypothetical protein [Ligilactobacillus salivarius]MBE5068039.1 hypothetical protein [Ligilactobacillus salivarius]
MSYEYESYDNLNELKKVDSKLANELIQYSWTENWKDEYFLVFPNKVEFAKYELEDGWYEGLGLEVVQGTKYKGAVNPFNYIDYKRLADDLIKDWDRSLNYASNEGKIVRTSYGF